MQCSIFASGCTSANAKKNCIYGDLYKNDEIALTETQYFVYYEKKKLQLVEHAVPELPLEGYPDLVVQGQLLASLLMNFFAKQRPEKIVKKFTYQSLNPLFLSEGCRLAGKLSEEDEIAQLWVSTAAGDRLIMEVDLEFE